MIGVLFALVLAPQAVSCQALPLQLEQTATLVGDVGMDMRHADLWINLADCRDAKVLLLLTDIENAEEGSDSQRFLDQLYRAELSLLEEGRLGPTRTQLRVRATGTVIDAQPGRGLRVSDVEIVGGEK